MNPSAQASTPPAVRQHFLTPGEILVLAFLIAAVAMGAVMSARLLQKRVLASYAETSTLPIQEHPNNSSPTRSA